jgi:PIN domain nuclease of toxin-antitoxin system
MIAIADTHALVWYLAADRRLSETARRFIEGAVEGNEAIGVSAITLVELVYLTEKKRISAEMLARVFAEVRSTTSVFQVIPLDLDIVQNLPRVAWDAIPELPDRVIAATALHFAVPVISRDARIQASGMETVW